MHLTVSLPGPHTARLCLPKTKIGSAMIEGLEEEEGTENKKYDVHVT